MKTLNVISFVSIALALFSCEDNYDMMIDRIGHAWITATGGAYMNNGDIEPNN